MRLEPASLPLAAAEAGPASSVRPGPSAPPRRRVDPRWFSSSLLTLILVVGQWKFQILGDYARMAISLGTAIVAEIVLSRWLRKEWPNLLSAYISGNSIVILTKPVPGILWPFWGGALISIASKYVLNYRKRHLWNPTNFGVCMMMLLAPTQVTMLSHEWGNTLGLVALIWCFGLFVVWRAKVWHLTLTYLVAFVALAWVRTLFNGQPFGAEVAPITGAMYTLYIFFMITDPRTIVSGRKKQLVVVLIVALVECLIRMACDFELIPDTNPLSFAPPMYALFIVGPIALFIELYRNRNAPARVARSA